MTDNNSLHFVYIVNEDGMSRAFVELKQKLAQQHHATLIYLSSNDSFVFNRELEILEKRFPAQFVMYQLKEMLPDCSASVQELLEAVINSNTRDNLIFILSQNEELIHTVSNRLWFLGISKTQIQIL